MRFKQLAWALIKQLTQELTAAETKQERAEVWEEQKHVGFLLAFLWASEWVS